MALSEILKALKVPRQEALYVHSSIDWIKRAGLGLMEVLMTLRDWVTPRGTLVMPGYPFRGEHLAYLRQNPTFDVRNTPVKIGLLPEVFRRVPGVIRSLDPDFPVIAFGEQAAVIVGSDPRGEDPFGPESPYRRMLEMGTTLVGLGVSLNTNSFIHVLDSQLQNRYGFPVCCEETFGATVKDYNGRVFVVRRKALRPEFQTNIEPGAVVEEIGGSEELFSSFQIDGVQFFRWSLMEWERFCLKHAIKSLEQGKRPCWLRRVV